MQQRILGRSSLIFPLFAVLFLYSFFLSQAQSEPIPFDTSVVEIIERIPVTQSHPTPSTNLCGYEPNIRQSNWILMQHESDEPVLCNADTGEIREIPIEANWITRREPIDPVTYWQPSESPDGEWLVLIAFESERYEFYAVSTSTDDVIALGGIPYNRLSSYPPNYPTWLSSTQGAIVYSTNSDSVWDTLYGFDLAIPDSMTEIMSGYPRAIDTPPPRVESLYSGRWLSRKAGADLFWNTPCEFSIYDAEGLRIYPLEYDCQVEAWSPDPNNAYNMIRSDGETILVLRVIDFDSGQSELVSMSVMTLEAEPTVLYRGEIDFMIANVDNTTLSVLGTDGRIPYTLHQEYMFVDLRQFAGNDLLLATQRGAHIIPADEIPNNFSEFIVEILATSPDDSHVLLSNGAIYDVVEDRLVANITGGAMIEYTTVTWHEDGRLVFNYDYFTKEQITIRLRE